MAATSTEIRIAIQDLYHLYMDTLDDGPLEDWPSLFADPCDYRIIPRENYENDLPLAVMRCESVGMLVDRVKSVQKLQMFEHRYLRHMLSNLQVREVLDNGDRLKVTANYMVLETLRDGFTRILNSGRYIDEVVRDGSGSYKFKVKHCVFDSELIPNSIVYPV